MIEPVVLSQPECIAEIRERNTGAGITDISYLLRVIDELLDERLELQMAALAGVAAAWTCSTPDDQYTAAEVAEMLFEATLEVRSEYQPKLESLKRRTGRNNG